MRSLIACPLIKVFHHNCEVVEYLCTVHSFSNSFRGVLGGLVGLADYRGDTVCICMYGPQVCKHVRVCYKKLPSFISNVGIRECLVLYW